MPWVGGRDASAADPRWSHVPSVSKFQSKLGDNARSMSEEGIDSPQSIGAVSEQRTYHFLSVYPVSSQRRFWPENLTSGERNLTF